MKLLENRTDIESLVNHFYQKARKDEKIGYIFEEIAHVHWEEHLPRMYDFWDNVAFYSGKYQGNLITPHIELNKKIRLMPEHFCQWLKLFTESIDELFEGELATELKIRATSIGGIMEAKIKTIPV